MLFRLWSALFRKSKAATEASAIYVRRAVAVDGVTYPYQVFVPRRREREPAPVVLFLHGSGERGNDGVLQTTAGIGPMLMQKAADFPAIVVLPQVPKGSAWTGAPAQAAIVALDEAVAEFGGDPGRMYLTGVSMGAYGAWEIALLNPDRFAALVPICGGLRPIVASPSIAVTAVARADGDVYQDAAQRLASIPTWIFHGADDPVVPVEGSRAIAAALRNVGAPVHYTEYAGVGHLSWDRAYAEAELWTWLFAQRLAR